MDPTTGPPERPFVGLRPFKTHEALIFFGRQRQTVELLERLHRTRFVGVIGSSGSGKSSLIYAGLVPALQAGFLVGDRDHWIIVRLTPGDNPWLRLTDALRAALAGIGLEKSTDLREIAEGGGVSGLVQVVGPLLARANANLLLFVDQFEEIFRRDASHGPQQHEEDTDFVAVVLDLARQREVPVFVVFTMRSDHLGDCDDFLGLPEALNESQYLVPRLSREEVRLAIEGPIRLFQKDVAPRLVDRLLNDLGGQHDQLPVLQHALMRMWLRLVESGQQTMDLEHYKDVGTLSEALWRHADEALAGLDPASVHPKEAVKAALDGADPEEIRFFKIVFQALTDTDHANRKVRRWQSLRELRELTGRNLPQLYGLLERFVDDRRSFLRYSGEGGSTGPEATLVDISHESLIRQWDRLMRWVEEEAHDRDTYVRLRDDARRWEAGAGGLWEDPGLAQARLWWNTVRPTALWAKRYRDGFETAERFLRESERKRNLEREREWEEARREQERLELAAHNAQIRRTLRRTAVAAVVALSLAVVAFWQWRRAEGESLRAESSEEAAWGLSVLRTDPEQSLRRAIKAVDTAPTTTSAGALREALNVAVVRKLWSLRLARASAVAFSPDGRRLAAGSTAGTTPGAVGIWDSESGQLQASRCGPAVATLHWTPDGNGVLLGLADGSIVLWDGAGQRGAGDVTTLVPAGALGQVEDVDLRPDGKDFAVAAGVEGLLRFDLVRDASGPQARAKGRALAGGEKDAVASVAYSPDGGRLAMGGSKGTVTLLDTTSGQPLCETRPLGVEILRVAWSSPGLGLVAASSYDHAVRSWPAQSCRSEPTRHVGHRNFVMDIGFTSDDAYLVSVSHDSTIRLWDPRVERDELFSRRVTRSSSNRTLAYDLSRLALAPPRPTASRGSPARTRIATIGAEREEGESVGDTLMVWDLASRADADMLKALTGGAPAVDLNLLPDRLSLARALRVEPKLLDEQLPRCP
jgi:hypothetical protein